MIDRVRIGIEGLDEVLGGGFPRGSLILLAGEPGTGKTAFSINFVVKGAASGEPGVYAGFGEDKGALIECFGGHLGVDLAKLEAGGALRLLDFTAMREEGASAILDTILEEVEALGARRLAIDPFSAMAQAIGDRMDIRIIAQTILGRIVRRMGCTTIMVEEVPIGGSGIGFGVEEFVADGIIRLRAGELDGRLIRELELVKLRGTELVERKLAFTLKGGFKAFAPSKPKPIPEPKRFQPIPDPPGMYSTGSGDLDAALGGGVPRGSTMLIEVDERVSKRERLLFTGPMVSQFLFQGKGAIVIPSIGVDARIIRGVRADYGTTEGEFNRERIIEIGSLGPGEERPNLVKLEGVDWREDFERIVEVWEGLRAETGQSNLWIAGLDTIIDWYGEDICERVFNKLASIARRADSMLVAQLMAGHGELATKLASISDIHLRLTREHGCLLLYGVKPRTGLYAVEMDASRGYPLPRLTPIV